MTNNDLDLSRDPEYQTELLKLDVAILLSERMEALGVSRTLMAERLGVSQSRVTQILAGYSNITLSTLAHAALALDLTVRFDLVEIQDAVQAAPISGGSGKPHGNASSSTLNRQLALAA